MNDRKQEKTKYPGIYKVTYPNGDVSWRRVWREGGRGSKQRSRNFDTLKDAQWFDPSAPDDDTPKQSARIETFGAYGERWKATLGAKRKPRTITDYLSRYAHHVEPRFGAMRVDTVKWSDVEAFMADMRTAGASEGTVANAYMIVRMVLGVAVDDGAVPANVCVGKGRSPGTPQRKKGDRLALTVEQLDMLTDEVGEHYGLLVRFLALSGLRIGEAAALRVLNFDELHGVIRVAENRSDKRGDHVGTPKGNRSRDVEIPASLAAALAAHIKACGLGPSDRVFRTVNGCAVGQASFNRRVVQPAVRRLAERGVFPAHFTGTGPGTGNNGFTVHDLRRTYASLARDAGVHGFDIQRQLGHVHADTTFGYAATARVGTVGAALDKVAAL